MPGCGGDCSGIKRLSFLIKNLLELPRLAEVIRSTNNRSKTAPNPWPFAAEKSNNPEHNHSHAS
ncbi:MAG: hypothetical protein LEGION0403_FIIPPAGN_01492 [Legionella sp.]